MAVKIDEFAATSRRSKYPLDEWLDGGVWQLAAGEDFKQSSTSMRSVLYTAAKRRGGTVRTRTVKQDDGPELLQVQFVPGGESN